jgi:hypothetical protein
MIAVTTVSLTDAKGKTLQAAVLEDRRAIFLWTDQTVSILYAESAGWDGDEPSQVDEFTDTVNDVSDLTLEDLGLLTREERLQRAHDFKEKADASRLNYEQQQYARLKQKFEKGAV